MAPSNYLVRATTRLAQGWLGHREMAEMDWAGVAAQSTPSGYPWGLSPCLQAQGAYRVCPTCEQAERPKLEAAQDFDFDSSLGWTQNSNQLRDKPYTRACIVS